MTDLVVVHGMRRSGNHAIIDWIRRNFGAPSVFLNDCGPGDPFETFALMETPERHLHGPEFRETRWFPQFPDARSMRPHVVSYEDRTPDETGAPQGWAVTHECKRVIVHRSFLNWLASYFVLVARKQKNTLWGVSHPKDIRPVLGTYGRLLAAADEKTAISFDHWQNDAGYRNSRLAALGLTPRDDSFGGEETYGGGSSFSDDAPSERWRTLADDPDYCDLACEAARDDALMTHLSSVYPEDAARLARLEQAGSFDLEETPWFS